MMRKYVLNVGVGLLLIMTCGCGMADGKEEQSVQAVQEESDEMTVEDFLWESVPELHSYAEYIERESGGEASLYIEIQEAVELDVANSGNVQKFYPVYVGEERESNTANWDWFYVSEDMSVIYWQNIVEGEYYSLEDWRKSESYRNL